tara:strand:- start:761 stop:1393 length:633 start_codon:yes stop_codon:yes gene_type:complete
MFKNNKYRLWHNNIIAKAKNRTLDCYKEKHHILPRSLGGSNDKSNLVELTAREHFIVHMLLCKFTVGEARRSMLYAFKAMSYYIKDGRDYKIHSRIASKLREELKFSDEHISNLSKSHLGKKVSNETKRKMSLKHVRHTYLTDKKIKFKDGNKHRVIIHKGTKTKRVNLENIKNYLEKGFKLGRYREYFTKEYSEQVNQLTQEYWNRRLA